MVDISLQGKPRYIMSCCMVQQKSYEEAYVELSRLIALCDSMDEAHKLRAYIGFDKMSPPRYEQSLLDMFHLLSKYPNDLDLVRRMNCSNVVLFLTRFDIYTMNRYCNAHVYILGYRTGVGQ